MFNVSDQEVPQEVMNIRGTRISISGVRGYQYPGYEGINIKGRGYINIRGTKIWIQGYEYPGYEGMRVRGYEYLGYEGINIWGMRVRGYKYLGYECINILGTRVYISGVGKYECTRVRGYEYLGYVFVRVSLVYLLILPIAMAS